ncbi:RNA-dependent RNA polymerase [Mycena chlorophos]|uniref:RNA-dependent RNA polymerase n=1 Tax=Mycena chlorophos TaxID=658473 RepID=A0A8H6VUG6_MYCCL|nr:RNA-dependent RNA polymerase [Mycena chlorophos]
MDVNRPSLSFSIEDDITVWGALVPSQMLRVEAADPPAQNLSQHSSFSDIEDISHLILEAPVGTQLVRAMDASKFKKDGSFARTDSTSSAGSSSGSSKQWSANTSLTSVGSAVIATTSSVKLEMLPGPGVPRKRKLSDLEAPQAGPKPPKVPRRESSPEDEPVIISHSPSVQRTFNNLEIPYGVQFEINRLAIRHGFDALQATALEVLRGKTTAESIPLIPGLFGQQAVSTEDAFAKEIASKAPWAELDVEEKHLGKNPLAGMFPETEGWFGGKVHFRGTIGESYKVFLKPPELGTSSRFARRFGSCRILTLGLDKKLLNANAKNGGTKLLDFLRRPFILGGCVFRAFDAKDGNVFLFATNEIVEGSNVNRIRTIPGLLSLPEFLNWHNPIICDVKQTMAKWAARYALGRSNSVPVLRLEEGAIGAISDIKSSTGSDMTDGAGTINKAGLRLIDKSLKPEAWPTAVQVRVAGAKGLLVMDPDDAEETPRIALRPSQIKVKHDLQKLGDPTLRTIDLLRTANCRTSCRLSVETIINLADNGVPTSVFLSLVEAAMIRLVTPLITWEGPHAMEKLWDAVARTGGVIPARLARQETVLARQKGYYEQKIEEEEEEDADNQPSSIAWWVDEISGCPSSLEETVLALLDSGFRPETCSVLRAKLEKVVESCLNRYVESYRIDLPVGKAATAFIVPDMHGVLEPGEFFLKSTRFDFVTEDGGDYDGDVALVIWEPSIVSDFKNAPNHYSEEPAAIGNAFSPQNETVAQFLERTKDMTADQVLREQQAYLLSAIRDVAIVGQYSTWHLNAIYTLGYRHEETIRLAYMFCKTLDGAKTGLQVLPAGVPIRSPKVRQTGTCGAKEAQRGDETNLPNLQRPSKLGPFVMDEIYRHTDKKWNTTDWGRKLKEEVDLKFDRKRPHVVDSELTAPWLEFQAQETLRITAQKAENVKIQAVAEYAQNNEELKEIAQELLDKLEKGVTSDLDLIREHVKEVYVAHQKKIGRSFTKMKIERRQDILRELSRQFAEGTKKLSMSADQGLKLMASYAYFYDCDQRKGRSPGWSRFPWDVAFRELCLIKTRATKTMKPVASGFYNLFQMKKLRD